MKNTKKTIAGIMAFAMMLSLASCGDGSSESSGGNNNGGNNNSSITAESVAEKSYKAIELGGSLPLNYINRVSAIGDTGKVLITGNDENGSAMYVTDYEFTDFSKIDFEVSDGEGNSEAYYDAMVGADGTIYIFANITSYGDMELPDWDDPDFDSENFDWDAFYEAAEYTHKLYTIDTEGTILTENEITGLEAYSDDDFQANLNGCYLCGDKFISGIYTQNEDVFVTIGTDGVIGDEVDLGEDGYRIYNAVQGDDGNLYYATYASDSSDNIIKHIDSATMTVSDDYITVKSEDFNYINTFMMGYGDYKFLISDTSALYGLKEDGTTEEVINWVDSDLTGDYIDFVMPVENNEFIVHERDWNKNTDSFYRLTKRDASELENVQIISMVVSYSDQDVMDKVKQFNQENDGYRIKVEDYNKYYEWDDESGETLNSPEAQLKLDIAAGKTPDIIYMYGNSELIGSLGRKGALADMYELMGTDGTVSKDDIVPNVLGAGEVDGKLVSIASSFYVSTFAVKTKFYDKPSWTMGELIEAYNNCPEGMSLFNDTNVGPDYVLNNLLYSGDFIDMGNGTCNFDSPEFIKLLEFCNRFESEEIDWDSMSNDEMNDYWDNYELAIKNDKALIQNMNIYSLRDYSRQKYVNFGDEEFNIVGIPGFGGNGGVTSLDNGFSIMANSDNKEACWKFISSFFDEDYQTSDRMYSIPALKSAFESKLDETMKNPYYIDENGKKHEYDNTYYLNDKEIKIPNLTQEERDSLEEYILGAESNRVYLSENVQNIIREETSAYFNGERSAQETASIIQDRVSIMVSEQS
ncbi:MAG: extracellular solute-binding protein [Ruminococcus flavefaciens]|nr:extracellular solute-binding protein [Ruminococcus flavefaciens]MCM1231192.1 extracellular solute-binding protein [Ruminococcus flavefaciens]